MFIGQKCLKVNIRKLIWNFHIFLIKNDVKNIINLSWLINELNTINWLNESINKE